MVNPQLESEVGRYAYIYCHTYGKALRIGLRIEDKTRAAGNDQLADDLHEVMHTMADRAAAWFANRMTDDRLAGPGLRALNSEQDWNAARDPADTATC